MMASGKPLSFFIAYSRQDYQVMRRVRDWLRAAGFDVWSDEDLTIGSIDWQRSVQRAIDAADYLLVLLSPDARESPWVAAEIHYARTQNIKVLPLLTRGSLNESTPFSVIQMRVIDITGNFESAMARLIAAIMQGQFVFVSDEPTSEAAPTPQTTWSHEVFLSYSRKDIELMRQVRETLQDAMLRVWSDEVLEVGTPSWLNAIQKAIENAGCLVGILSPDAKASEWVREELNYAYIQERRRFLLLARGETKTAVPFGVAQIQFADIRKDYAVGMRKTITDIKSFLSLS